MCSNASTNNLIYMNDMSYAILFNKCLKQNGMINHKLLSINYIKRLENIVHSNDLDEAKAKCHLSVQYFRNS